MQISFAGNATELNDRKRNGKFVGNVGACVKVEQRAKVVDIERHCYSTNHATRATLHGVVTQHRLIVPETLKLPISGSLC